MYVSRIPFKSTERMKVWGLNTDSYPVNGKLASKCDSYRFRNKGIPLVDIMTLVCPDTDNSLTAPVILILIVNQMFLEGDQTVSADNI